jgi:hypothetical protein
MEGFKKSPGRAARGSQRQVQDLVNSRPEELNEALRCAFPELGRARIEWVAPLEDDFYREPRGARFLDLVGCADLVADLDGFWPAGGPVWDALARVDLPDRSGAGVVLVEAKSYPAEMFGAGTRAGRSGSERSRLSLAKILKAVAWTQERVGVDEAAPTPAEWIGPQPGLPLSKGSLYQTVNRLAMALWLCGGVAAEKRRKTWLVDLCFYDDPIRPTSREEWEMALRADHELLRIPRTPPFWRPVFLPAI